MNIKLILKISVLLFALFLVVVGRRFFMSAGFHKNVADVFAVHASPFQWCTFERKVFVWTEIHLASKFKTFSQESLAQKFCMIQAETIQGVDIQLVNWTSIAESVDSEGQKVVLEWNKEKKLFRANGLPFKSSNLSQELSR